MRRLLALLTCALLMTAGAATLTTTAAQADGDPASDILLGQDAFYPYAPNTVAVELKTALDGMLKQAKAKKFELKVAMIAGPLDLGAVPQLISQPQKYADLLTSEIAFNTKPRVLVVLPDGLGGNNLGDDAGPALSGLTVEKGAGADGLARAAMLAVGRLTKANGTPVPVPAVANEKGRSAGKRGGGGASPLLVFGLPVALVAIVGGIAALRGRGRTDDEDEDEDEDGADDDEESVDNGTDAASDAPAPTDPDTPAQ